MARAFAMMAAARTSHVPRSAGIGGLAYGEQSPEGIKLTIDTYIAPLLQSVDATNVNAAMQRVAASVQGNSFAKSAIETALLDAQGQRLGLPVQALLGGAFRSSLPVLWTLASGDAGRDVDEARSLIEARRHRGDADRSTRRLEKIEVPITEVQIAWCDD